MASATYLTPQSPVAVTGAASGLFVYDTAGLQHREIPMTKTEIKRNAKIGDVTGSTDVVNRDGGATNTGGQNRVADAFVGGSIGASVSVSAFWRTGQAKAPCEFFEGDTYYFNIYIRRAGWRSAADTGLYHTTLLIIEDISMSLDPKSGAIEWNMSTRANGYIGKPIGDL